MDSVFTIHLSNRVLKFVNTGKTVWEGNTLIGRFDYEGTLVRVTDYREDTGYVGTMGYEEMVDYFCGFEN